MLPNWAQLLDWAARLSSVSEEAQGWFTRFTNSAGVDDSRTVLTQSRMLIDALTSGEKKILAELERVPGDKQPSQILAAWKYALDTMMLEAATRPTCSWKVEGIEEDPQGGGHSGSDGEITLRRP